MPATLIAYYNTSSGDGGAEAMPFFFVWGLVFALMFGPIVLMAYWPYLKSRSWEFAFGIVQDVSVGEGAKPGAKPDQTWYWVELRYTYRAKGRGYEGSRIGPKREYTSDRGKAKIMAAHFRPDEKVRVHFDPKDPATAMLRRPVPPEHINLLMVGLMLAAVAAGVAWLILDLVWDQLPPGVVEFFKSDY